MTAIEIDGTPVGTIERVQLEPGDVLVVTTPLHVNAQQAALIGEQLRAYFPGHDMVVISDGTRLGVVKPDQPDESDVCPHGRLFGCAICLLDGPGGPQNPSRGD